MRKKLTIAAAILAMSGCAQQLSEEDRAMLMETQALAMEARNQSAQAVQMATAANMNAAQGAQNAQMAAQAAQAANERAERMMIEQGSK